MKPKVRFSRVIASVASIVLAAAGGAAHAMPTVDVMFLLDASGSVGADQFLAEKALVKKIHADFSAYQTAGQANYRYSVIRFASSASTRLNFSGANSSYSDALIDGIAYTKGSSYLKTAVQMALNVFDAQSPSFNQRQLFLFTDGLPNPSSQDPSGLASALVSAKINTTILGLSGFNGTSIAPIVNVASDVISMEQYRSSHTQAINQRLLQPANAVPEPSSLALALLPLFGLLMVRRKAATPV